LFFSNIKNKVFIKKEFFKKMNLNEELYRIKQIIGLITESENFSEYMSKGAKSDEVKKLQEILDIETDGVFGSETKDCVKKLQTHFNIKVDGIVGPETRSILNNISQGKTDGWEGCKKTTPNNKPNLDTEKQTEISTPQSSKIVGSDWNSCKAWRNKGGLSKWGNLISISKGDSEFNVKYVGPSSGLSIAHAKGGGDTIHQLYNVLICEINPFLSKGGLKPDIENIRTLTGKNGKNSELSISVPLVKDSGVYQLDRRGGWGHDPGSGKMSQKCNQIENKGKFCFGPIKNITQGPFGKITEYFITHKI
jgi:peptidoglycan hydrolase-like protein with peptidoglycan-binding domain